MSQRPIEQVKIGLSQTTLMTEEQQEQLLKLSMILSSQTRLIQEIYVYYKRRSWPFEYKPTLGSPLIITYNNSNNHFTIERTPLAIHLTEKQFLYWLACCDRAFFPIYSIGTTVSLEQQLLTEDVRNMFEGHQEDLLVTLIGRKIPVDLEEYDGVIDYVGVMYPFGAFPDTPTILITNPMIKEVKHPGWLSDYEEKFAEKLKEQQLLEGRLSVAYIREKGGS